MKIAKSIAAFFRNCFKKRVIRDAALNDLDFLTQSYIAGAKNGHFVMQQSEKSVTNMFKSAIKDGGYMRELSNRSLDFVQMHIFILTINNHIVGFQAISPSIEKDSIELYYCFVSPLYRNRRVMQDLVNFVIDKYPPKTRFIARCFNESQIAINKLKQMNFTIYRQSSQMQYLEYIK
ncbi:MAG: GNAT family N-acetyltransferase [Sphingobacteriaceae bacterium]|nr:GNAT family N-acetyltransferase [Sphingobacteriaceae bacterium]